MKRQGGFTIAEVLVTTAIAGMLMTVVASLLVMVGRSFREQQGRANLQGELLLAREDLLENLTGAAVPTLPAAGQLVSATFRKRGVPQYKGGIPQWQSYVGYRKDGTKLVRSTLAFTPATTLPTLPANLNSVVAARKITVARSLSELTFTLEGKFLDSKVKVHEGQTTLEGTFSCLLEDGLML